MVCIGYLNFSTDIIIPISTSAWGEKNSGRLGSVHRYRLLAAVSSIFKVPSHKRRSWETIMVHRQGLMTSLFPFLPPNDRNAAPFFKNLGKQQKLWTRAQDHNQICTGPRSIVELARSVVQEQAPSPVARNLNCSSIFHSSTCKRSN